MDAPHGMMIRSDTQNVLDVYAPVWNSQEIRRTLSVRNVAIVFQDIGNDSIVFEAFLNVGEDGQNRRKNGFELLGKRFFGNALIIPQEGRASPQVTPQEIAYKIRFLQTDEQRKGSDSAAA